MKYQIKQENFKKGVVRIMEKKIFGYEYNKQYEYENGFYLVSPLSRISKLITHWELYKRIINIPG